MLMGPIRFVALLEVLGLVEAACSGPGTNTSARSEPTTAHESVVPADPDPEASTLESVKLQPVEQVTAFWFSWSDSYPHTKIAR